LSEEVSTQHMNITVKQTVSYAAVHEVSLSVTLMILHCLSVVARNWWQTKRYSKSTL